MITLFIIMGSHRTSSEDRDDFDANRTPRALTSASDCQILFSRIHLFLDLSKDNRNAKSISTERQVFTLLAALGLSWVSFVAGQVRSFPGYQ